MGYNRAKIKLETTSDISEFVQILQTISDDFIIEDKEGALKVNARSLLGVTYASMEFDEMYLVNKNKGTIPYKIDRFREGN